MSAKLTAFAVSRPGAYYDDFLLDSEGSSSLSVSLLRSCIDDFLSDIIQILFYFYSETLKSNDLGTQIQTRFGVPGKNCDFNIY